MHFSNQITIQRPVHQVFGFVADPENIPKWNYAIEETRKTSDGPRRRRTTRLVRGGCPCTGLVILSIIALLLRLRSPSLRAMNDLLADYELKRRRAMFHLDALGESIQRFTDAERQFVRGEPDPDGRKYVFRVPLQPIDPAWALMVGDFAFNRRASLDYLITALIRHAENDEHETSQFPIYGINRIGWAEIDAWWDTDRRHVIENNLKGTPSGTKAALKVLQPSYGAPAVDPRRHPLFWLQTLSNRDKHRGLNLLARNASVLFTDAQRKPIFDYPGPADFRMTGIRVRDTYAVSLTTQVEPDVDMYVLATHDVAFHEPPALMGNVLETLTGINNFIEGGVVPTIQSLMT